MKINLFSSQLTLLLIFPDDFTNNKTVDLVRESNSCQLQGNAKIIGQAKFGWYKIEEMDF